MSSSSRNASILNFFKHMPEGSGHVSPAPTTSKEGSHSAPVAGSPPSTPPKAPLLDTEAGVRTPPELQSSPVLTLGTPIHSTPSPEPAKPLIIGASDSEGDDYSSDDPFEDLSAILGRAARAKPIPQPSRPANFNPLTTPKAKRTAVEFHSSPLAIIPKHKFDMKALAQDALLDNATNLSSMRAMAAKEAARKEAQPPVETTLEDALTKVVDDNGGKDAQKVIRAVRRAETGQPQLRYCFFDQEFEIPSPRPIPKKAATGVWKLIAEGDPIAREQHFASGLPHNILQKTGSLPDELFEWILDDICIQPSSLVRQEYYHLIKGCSSQVERLVTPDRLKELFIRIGASRELNDSASTMKLVRLSEDPYQDRDWGYLQSLIVLIGFIAPQLHVGSVIYAANTLLRMALDRVVLCSIDTLREYEHAIQQLLEAIPQPSWPDFMQNFTKNLGIWMNCILCLPISNQRTHDVRRRLAIASIFGNCDEAHKEPDNVVTIRRITECLDKAPFIVNPKTDFAALKAGILLLDISIDDGSFVDTGNAEDEKRFNTDVDELASKLREIWRRINDSGMKLARTEAKSNIEWIQQRLSYSVRTRRKAKKSVFDIAGQREDASIPQQQAYMSNFLKKPPTVAGNG